MEIIFSKEEVCKQVLMYATGNLHLDQQVNSARPNTDGSVTLFFSPQADPPKKRPFRWSGWWRGE